MTWDEMERLVRAAYLEGIKDGVIMQARQSRRLTEDQQQSMWECSDASRDLPESVT